MNPIHTQAREYVHQHLLQTIDLRRLDYNELRSGAFREKVETWVEGCLSDFLPDPSLARHHEFVRDLVDEVVGLGPLEALLRDPDVNEIMVNGKNNIFVERKGSIVREPTHFSSDEMLRSIIDRIVSPLGRRVDESSPMVDARLKDGSRVNIILPPLALCGPTITIRKFSKEPLSISRMIDWDSLTSDAAEFLRLSVLSRRNILIAGGTGSGKTTLLNALAGFITEGERIVTIEDSAELKLPQKHVVSLEARPANVEGRGEISIRDLVRNALRMRPDRIVVGECRGGESLDMLQAMNTGHDGSMTTLHANSPRDALLRLETLVLMAGYDLPLRAIREQIGSAIDLVLFQTRYSNGKRKLTHITELCGLEDGVILSQDLFVREHEHASLTCKNRPPTFQEKLDPTVRKKFLSFFANRKKCHVDAF